MNGLWGAAEAGDLAEVQRLIGEDPSLLNDRDYYNRTPLMLAAGNGHMAVVQWLVGRGAALDERNFWDGYTALCYASIPGHTPVVQLLLERGADPTIADHCGRTPLIQTTMRRHAETVRCLLDHPSAAATINHCSTAGGGITALWWACALGHVGMVRALLEKEADPTIADRDGQTPMAMAKQYNYPACVEALEVRCSLSPFHLRLLTGGADETFGCVVGVAGRRRSGHTCSGRPGRWRMRPQALRHP
jgi:uncharacterized protein